MCEMPSTHGWGAENESKQRREALELPGSAEKSRWSRIALVLTAQPGDSLHRTSYVRNDEDEDEDVVTRVRYRMLMNGITGQL